jgi:hypothetical protein
MLSNQTLQNMLLLPAKGAQPDRARMHAPMFFGDSGPALGTKPSATTSRAAAASESDPKMPQVIHRGSTVSAKGEQVSMLGSGSGDGLVTALTGCWSKCGAELLLATTLAGKRPGGPPTMTQLSNLLEIDGTASGKLIAGSIPRSATSAAGCTCG